MSAVTELPTEILQLILLNLKGREAWGCRSVCRHWRAVVDSLPDASWRHFCFRDFRCDPTLAKQHSNLTYRELYKSLYLWDRVDEAEVRRVDLPPDLTNKAVANSHLISNLLGIAIERQRFGSGIRLFPIRSSDTIEYYSVESLELVTREHYPFLFCEWHENEKLIILKDLNKRLHIVLKTNPNMKDRPEFVYDLFDSEDPNFSAVFSVNEVVFLNVHKSICIARLNAVNGEETIETRELAKMTEYYSNILSFSYAGRNRVNVMTIEYFHSWRRHPKIKIYCVQEKLIQLIEQMSLFKENLAKKLKDYGFCWTDPVVYDCIGGCIPRDFRSKYIAPLDIAPCIHNHVVLIGTAHLRVHIINKPYLKNGDLMLTTKQPNKTLKIKLTESEYTLYTESDAYTGVQQLNVVEIINGHRIFCVSLTKMKMSIFDLLHNNQPKDKKRRKRRAADDEPGTSGKRSKRSKNQEKSDWYSQTRSSVIYIRRPKPNK